MIRRPQSKQHLATTTYSRLSSTFHTCGLSPRNKPIYDMYCKAFAASIEHIKEEAEEASLEAHLGYSTILSRDLEINRLAPTGKH